MIEGERQGEEPRAGASVRDAGTPKSLHFPPFWTFDHRQVTEQRTVAQSGLTDLCELLNSTQVSRNQEKRLAELPGGPSGRCRCREQQRERAEPRGSGSATGTAWWHQRLLGPGPIFLLLSWPLITTHSGSTRSLWRLQTADAAPLPPAPPPHPHRGLRRTARWQHSRGAHLKADHFIVSEALGLK